MVIEVLFNESCNLHGDGENATYLQKSLPDAKFIFTNITQEPYFVKNTPDMIYIGSMSESIQRRVINVLTPYKDRIKELIDNNVIILATGNAGEIFTKEIDYVSENIKVNGLGILDATTKTDFFDRYNGKVLGDFEDSENIKIIGFRSQFSFMYRNNENNYFVKCRRGVGINRESVFEGFRLNNLFVTQIIGPLLPLNPLFTEKIIKMLKDRDKDNRKHYKPAYMNDALDAYVEKLKIFENPDTKF